MPGAGPGAGLGEGLGEPMLSMSLSSGTWNLHCHVIANKNWSTTLVKNDNIRACVCDANVPEWFLLQEILWNGDQWGFQASHIFIIGGQNTPTSPLCFSIIFKHEHIFPWPVSTLLLYAGFQFLMLKLLQSLPIYTDIQTYHCGAQLRHVM